MIGQIKWNLSGYFQELKVSQEETASPEKPDLCDLNMAFLGGIK